MTHDATSNPPVTSTSGRGRFFSNGLNPFNILTFGKSRNHRLLLEIMEMSNDACMVTDKQGKSVIANSKMTELCSPFGIPSFSVLITLFCSPETTEKTLKAAIKKARSGEKQTIELSHNFEGQLCWYRLILKPVAGWKNYLYWRISDITTERENTKKQQEDYKKLIDYSENAPVGLFSVNQDGKFEFVNATFARWIEEDINTLLQNEQLHTYLVNPPIDGRPYDIKEHGGVRQIAELKMKSKSGRIFLASITQTVVHEGDGRVRTRAVVNDLSAEQAIRQALQDSESRFRQFFEEAPVGIAILDKNNQVKDCNPPLIQMLGKRPSQIENIPFTEMIDYADWSNAEKIIQKIASGETLSDPVEVRLWNAEHKKSLPCHMYARRFSDGDNITVHFLDLSQQKNLENQFIQSQKMQAVGQLAGGIAHDFNNLLTAIIGFCDLLLLRHKPGDPSFGDIQQIKQNSNRAANLVRQLLAFSRQQTLRPKTQDITDILTEVAHLLRRLIGVNINLNLVHGQNLGLVKVDSGQMEQVLVNMAVNARDAMDENGELIITTSHYTNTQTRSFGQDVMPIGDWVRIDIKDTGTGISPEVLEHIFEPFFTTKDVGQGTGLGLATVYGIVRQTGGYLGVESQIGQGTTFSIYLPRILENEDTAEEHLKAPEDVASDLTGTARILLVEDEDAVRTFSTRALKNKGYEVLTAENGDAGWSVFNTLDQKIDLLITDVMMPGKDGPTLAKEIRSVMPDLKIIFISGYTEEKLKDTIGDKIYFLPKPFTLKELAAKVKDVLQE